MVSIYYHSREVWPLFTCRGAFSADPEVITGKVCSAEELLVEFIAVEGRPLLGSQHVCGDIPRIIPGQV